ncbi:hypothetical protein GGS23DRAFT_239058 [Durotheca rogersii]|uniref:uncharacterized protein n=1 Tax=Durotheca rogersii TaxID=419775 RepID=UPI00221F6788|nr:uncharacterized protein GGS23DRAFT_239058 [Durotheca rogersii]KAI5860194.1 hypothetical protein GGS23DRAFT_239058 [Durotheca rogersii]
MCAYFSCRYSIVFRLLLFSPPSARHEAWFTGIEFFSSLFPSFRLFSSPFFGERHSGLRWVFRGKGIVDRYIPMYGRSHRRLTKRPLVLPPSREHTYAHAPDGPPTCLLPASTQVGPRYQREFRGSEKARQNLGPAPRLGPCFVSSVVRSYPPGETTRGDKASVEGLHRGVVPVGRWVRHVHNATASRRDGAYYVTSKHVIFS